MVDFIGIGAQKAATTWLWAMLRQHPEVRFSPLKEVHYFDVLYLGMKREKWLKSIRQAVDLELRNAETATPSDPERINWLSRIKDPDFAFTDDWYRHIFSGHDNAVTGDITPLYCALPDEGIEHVKRVAPRARLIYIIRDPVDRGVSALRYGTRKGSPLEKVIASRRYFRRGDYKSNIPRWERHFGQDRILYLPFGEVRRDPIGLLRQVEEHIGVGRFDGYRDVVEPVNSAGGRGQEVTGEMKDKVAELFAGQREFLASRFGHDFVSRIS